MQLFSSKLSRDNLDSIADAMGIQVYNYRDGERRNRGKYAGKVCHRFTLRPSSFFHDTSENFKRPRAWAVSWAGHYVFMKAIYLLDPDAVIKTGLGIVTGMGNMQYQGAIDFAVYANMTAHHNIGSMIEPIEYKDSQHRDHVPWNDEQDLDRMADFVAGFVPA